MSLHFCYTIYDIHLTLLFEAKRSYEACCVIHSRTLSALIVGILLCREQVNFQWDDDEIRFVLHQHAELDFYIASSLKPQSANRHVVPLGHIILIASQPVFTKTQNTRDSVISFCMIKNDFVRLYRCVNSAESLTSWISSNKIWNTFFPLY
jgi:hypothetical protein